MKVNFHCFILPTALSYTGWRCLIYFLFSIFGSYVNVVEDSFLISVSKRMDQMKKNYVSKQILHPLL